MVVLVPMRVLNCAALVSDKNKRDMFPRLASIAIFRVTIYSFFCSESPLPSLMCRNRNAFRITNHWFSSPSSSSSSPITRCPLISTMEMVLQDDGERQEQTCPWIFVGLGNPGKMFQGTRHNVGFEMIDAIASAKGISLTSVSFRALLGEGFIGKFPIILVKPQTFMNLSGESVAPIVSYYKVPLSHVLLIYDDLDLPFAKLRLLPKGGHGGHNGMRSVIERFKGSRDFPRLRIGIGRPPGKMDSTNFVLRSFNKQERRELDFAFRDGVGAAEMLVLKGFDRSATMVNSSTNPFSKQGCVGNS